MSQRTFLSADEKISKLNAKWEFWETIDKYGQRSAAEARRCKDTYLANFIKMVENEEIHEPILAIAFGTRV